MEHDTLLIGQGGRGRVTTVLDAQVVEGDTASWMAWRVVLDKRW